eukprot:CAMPEP_0179040248 /NCGR_PEP_ID=MMETSP0796-20121207/15550_1 /TAXON_ID=73915 /ORGANISM="Pyrodinium bahamense, Strain pbaha01" /LENGTH=908 /DNA_ID=CAMNT_0020736589 /DNA_START=39 /DNA_END=2762 /DNA_ORIENTATION=-
MTTAIEPSQVTDGISPGWPVPYTVRNTFVDLADEPVEAPSESIFLTWPQRAAPEAEPPSPQVPQLVNPSPAPPAPAPCPPVPVAPAIATATSSEVLGSPIRVGPLGSPRTPCGSRVVGPLGSPRTPQGGRGAAVLRGAQDVPLLQLPEDGEILEEEEEEEDQEEGELEDGEVPEDESLQDQPQVTEICQQQPAPTFSIGFLQHYEAPSDGIFDTWSFWENLESELLPLAPGPAPVVPRLAVQPPAAGGGGGPRLEQRGTQPVAAAAAVGSLAAEEAPSEGIFDTWPLWEALQAERPPVFAPPAALSGDTGPEQPAATSARSPATQAPTEGVFDTWPLREALEAELPRLMATPAPATPAPAVPSGDRGPPSPGLELHSEAPSEGVFETWPWDSPEREPPLLATAPVRAAQAPAVPAVPKGDRVRPGPEPRGAPPAAAAAGSSVAQAFSESVFDTLPLWEAAKTDLPPCATDPDPKAAAPRILAAAGGGRIGTGPELPGVVSEQPKKVTELPKAAPVAAGSPEAQDRLRQQPQVQLLLPPRRPVAAPLRGQARRGQEDAAPAGWANQVRGGARCGSSEAGQKEQVCNSADPASKEDIHQSSTSTPEEGELSGEDEEEWQDGWEQGDLEDGELPEEEDSKESGQDQQASEEGQQTPRPAFSVGSIRHYEGTCRPCAWMYKSAAGCRNGEGCDYCHVCPPGELKRRKREKAQSRLVAVHELRQRVLAAAPRLGPHMLGGTRGVSLAVADTGGSTQLVGDMRAMEPCYIEVGSAQRLPGSKATLWASAGRALGSTRTRKAAETARAASIATSARPGSSSAASGKSGAARASGRRRGWMPCMAVCSRLKKCAACSGKGELDNSVQAHLARAHCDKAVDNPVPPAANAALSELLNVSGSPLVHESAQGKPEAGFC